MIQVWYWCPAQECMMGKQFSERDVFLQWYNDNKFRVRVANVIGA